MRFVHASKRTSAEVTAFTDKSGWEHLLVVIKAAYSIPENGLEPEFLPPPPLAVKDDCAGEPGLSAPLYENDFSSRKHRCDVIFRANAHVPGNRPVKSLDVAVRVGAMSKAVHVVGDRFWEKDLFIIRHSEPKPFTTMPLHYGHAFGGSVPHGEKGELADAYRPNPVGTGYSSRKEHASLHGMKLPNLELPGRPLRHPDENYPAVALSPLARNFYPRHTYAGTYDQNWKDNVAPFLPDDFDERFFQCAPEDQQIDFPQGGEPVSLVNIMPGRPEVSFNLPDLRGIKVKVLRRDLSVEELEALPDTICFEPDEGRFLVVWRGSLRLGHKGLHEIRLATADEICPIWWESMRKGAIGCAGCADFDAENPPPGCPHKDHAPAIAAKDPLAGDEEPSAREGKK